MTRVIYVFMHIPVSVAVFHISDTTYKKTGNLRCMAKSPSKSGIYPLNWHNQTGTWNYCDAV